MPAAPLPPDELERQQALLRYDVLDTPVEAEFENIVRLLQRLLGTPIAAISLIDADRQWFQAQVGLPMRETHRDVSFCAYTMLGRDVMRVTDATIDPRFVDNELVTGALGIRGYIGAPLVAPDGFALGALCAIDTEAREFGDADADVVQDLAAVVVDFLELRRRAMAADETSARTAATSSGRPARE